MTRPTRPTPARTRKATTIPAVSAISPDMAVLAAAPRYIASPNIPIQRLKCDVPSVRSAASNGKRTPNTAALTPLTACPATNGQDPGSTANSSARSGSAPQPSSNSRLRPILSAARPTHGDTSATMACGTTMQAAIIRLAKCPARIVTAAPANGSIAAFDR
jgi:hypothetical protein